MENRTKNIARGRNPHRWSDTLATWRLCENAACQRARVCRGDEEACLKAKFPLLPELVREWYLFFFWHKEQRFTFDEMLENYEKSGHGQALRDWRSEGLRGGEAETLRHSSA